MVPAASATASSLHQSERLNLWLNVDNMGKEDLARGPHGFVRRLRVNPRIEAR
jgi:hypothetical protein